MTTLRSIRGFFDAVKSGEFKRADLATQCAAGWFDWFCPDRQLAKRTQTLAVHLATLRGSALIDQDSMGFSFKHTGNGSTFVRICDLATDALVFLIDIDSQERKFYVWGSEVKGEPLLTAAHWYEVEYFFRPELAAVKSRAH